MALTKFKKGTKVEWSWAGGIVAGTVEEIFEKTIIKEIKGKKITRHGSPEKPAYLVKSVAGNLALKLQTELRLPNLKTESSKKRPDNGDY